MVRTTFIFFIAVALFTTANAQTKAPSLAQSNTIALSNATIHTGTGEVLTNATIVFEKGKITAIGSNVSIPSNAEIINCAGKQIYPGLIAPQTKLGLEETEAIRSTLDYAETGDYHPNIRSIVAYNTDSKLIGTIRCNGVLYAMISPENGTLPGTGSVVQLDAWNWEDAIVGADIAVYLNMPDTRIRQGNTATKQQEDLSEYFAEIYTFFEEAYQYSLHKAEKVNLKFEAMKGLFTGKKLLIANANDVKQLQALAFLTEKYKLRSCASGASEAYLCTPILKKNNISILLKQLHSLPTRADDDVDLSYKMAKILADSGLLVGIKIDGSWQQRNLPFEAGTAVAYGLSKEQALSMISYNVAKIFGLDAKIGSLATGKQASIVICDGDILDMASSKINSAYIDGRKITLNNQQNELYEKYSEKYKQQGLLDKK